MSARASLAIISTVAFFACTHTHAQPQSIASAPSIHVIPGFPLQRSLRFWVHDTIVNGGTAPIDGELIDRATHVVARRAVSTPLVRRESSGEYLARTVAHLFTFDSLIPGTTYRLEVKGHHSVDVRTLPDSLDTITPFKLAAGSCYWYFGRNGATIDDAYPPETARCGNEELTGYRPDARLLMGDQIYADVFDPSGLRSPFRMISPVSGVSMIFHYAAYEKQWSDSNFLGFLSRTPTGVLADDHELWNGYPCKEGLSPWTASRPQRELADRAARETFGLYQSRLNPTPVVGDPYSFRFSIEPLSFYVIDSWLFKEVDKPHEIYAEAQLDSLLEWIRSLRGPGVIVTSSPILTLSTGLVKGVGNLWVHDPLAKYERQIDSIWRALATSAHDVLILGGDIHYSRFGEVDMSPWRRQLARSANGIGTVAPTEIGRTGIDGTVYEVISSPLSVVLFPAVRARQTVVTPCLLIPFSYCSVTARLDGKVAPQLPYSSIGPIVTAVESGQYAVIEFRRGREGVHFRVRHFPTARPGAGPLEVTQSSPERLLR